MVNGSKVFRTVINIIKERYVSSIFFYFCDYGGSTPAPLSSILCALFCPPESLQLQPNGDGIKFSLWGFSITDVTRLLTGWTFCEVVERSSEGNARVDTHVAYKRADTTQLSYFGFNSSVQKDIIIWVTTQNASMALVVCFFRCIGGRKEEVKR